MENSGPVGGLSGGATFCFPTADATFGRPNPW
jgi:hypothetical protein